MKSSPEADAVAADAGVAAVVAQVAAPVRPLDARRRRVGPPLAPRRRRPHVLAAHLRGERDVVRLPPLERGLPAALVPVALVPGPHPGPELALPQARDPVQGRSQASELGRQRAKSRTS